MHVLDGSNHNGLIEVDSRVELEFDSFLSDETCDDFFGFDFVEDWSESSTTIETFSSPKTNSKTFVSGSRS